MPIQFVGGTTGVLNSSTAATYSVSLTSLTGGIASAPADGDLIVIASSTSGVGSRSPGVNTAGYTLVQELQSVDTRTSTIDVAYKVAVASSDTSVTMDGNGNAGFGNSTVVMVFRGVDTTTPMDVLRTTATGTNGSRPNNAAITPVTSGAWIVACGAATGDTTPTAFTGPTGMTGFRTAPSTGSTSSSISGMAYTTWTTGAYDPAAWTGGESTTSDSWTAVTLALRPAIVTGTATLGGSGSLTASGTYLWDGASSLAGSSALSATGITAISGQASLAGSGALAATALTQSYTGYYKRVTEDGNFRVTQDSLYRIQETINLIIVNGDAALTGTSSLSVAGERIQFGVSSLTGSGSLTSSGLLTIPGASSLAATGSVSAAGTRSVSGDTSLSGSGAVSATATRTVAASSSLSAVGNLAAAGTRIYAATVSLSGSGTFVSSGNVVILAEANLSALGALSASALMTRYGSADLLGSSSVSADGITYRIGKIYAKSGDQWREITPSVKQSGSWVVPQTVYVKTGGEWKRVFINGN